MHNIWRVVMPGKTGFTRLIVFFSLFAVSGAVSAQDISTDLAVPVIRLEKHLMSLDYYDQFLGGDHIFEDYMYEIFRINQGDFDEGEGVVLEVMFGQDGSLLFEQALLSATERQSRWWMIHLSSRDYEIYYEVEVHDSGVSYFRFVVPYSMNLVVEMAEFTGLVDLVDYAEDESYQSWHTLSSGSEYLILEYYDLAKDTVIHIAVEDIIDDYSSGENFVIGIRED